ncbi:MAG: hypothetical protein NVS9B4_24180 [Candidatus Acidiferrum sp.]
MNTRRGFLGVMFGAALPLSRRGWWNLRAQDTLRTPIQGVPGRDNSPRDLEMPDPVGDPSNKKAALQENEKDIKKNVAKLYALAGDLKAEVDKTNSVNVLSIALLRKVEEIEKLAKEIKARAKG